MLGNIARRVTPFILDDLVSYVDMLGNLSFVTIAGVHHLFDNVRGDFQKSFEASIFFTAIDLLFSLTQCYFEDCVRVFLFSFIFFIINKSI